MSVEGASLPTLADPRTPVRGMSIEAAGRTLTVGELQRLLDPLPADSRIVCDGDGIRVAGYLPGLVLLDTGRNLPAKCPGCHVHGCDGRCQ